MNTTKYVTAQLDIAKQLLRWTLIIFPVSISIGLLVAFFLWLLDIVTVLRWQHLWIIFLLPLAGILIVWLYTRFEKNSYTGNHLIIDEIQPGGGVPFRMTPLILVTTIITQQALTIRHWHVL